MRTIAVLLLALLPPAGRAHDVVADRMLLVQREANHVSMTLVIDYVTILRAVAAPAASHTEFVVACAGMGDPALQRMLARAHATLERGIVLRDARRRALRVTPLRWPSLTESRKLLQQAAMTAVALRSDRPEPSIVEVQADALADRAIDVLDVELPAALAGMLIVSYKPVQTQVDPHSRRAQVRF